MTNHSERTAGHMRSALFVDFDNTYGTLREQDGEAAEAFAERPQDWVGWLEKSLPLPAGPYDGSGRNILVRRCYLNPKAFYYFRPHFVRAGFEVVDCPSFTGQGKNSADIKMVIDALDILNHPGVAYDEFVMLSGDADFIPLLLKLRAWDRRTSVLAFGNTSPAYNAASDHVIDQDDFIENALLGRGSSRPYAGSGLSSPTPGRIDIAGIEEHCAEIIQNAVREADKAVHLAPLAAKIREAYPAINSDWLGKGSFKHFLVGLELPGLKVHIENALGCIYDPSRHQPPEPREIGDKYEWFKDHPAELTSFARKIHDLTDIPCLAPEHYKFIFDAVADEINESGYKMSEISKAVRDRCNERDIPVSRGDINLILRGIFFAGHQLGKDTEHPSTLASKFHDSALSLCDRAQLTLSDEEKEMLEQWLCLLSIS